MPDEYAEYVETSFPGHFFAAHDPEDPNPFKTRAIGHSYKEDPTVYGLLIHYPGRWVDFPVEKYQEQLQTVYEIRRRCDVPLIWFGEPEHTRTEDYDLKLTSTTQVGLITKEGEEFTLSNDKVGTVEENLPHLDAQMETSFKNVKGQTKGINHHSTDGFHAIIKDRVGHTVIDLDLVSYTNPTEPLGIIEIKRSENRKIQNWYPYVGKGGDRICYELQFELAEQTNTTPYIITQDKPVPEINSNDDVFLYDFTYDTDGTVRDRQTGQRQNDDQIRYKRERVTAAEAANHVLENENALEETIIPL